MADEVPAREFAKRLVAGQGARVRRPFREQSERLLLAFPCPETDQPLQCETHEDVETASVARGDTSGLEQIVKSRPCHVPASLERLDHQLPAAPDHRGVDL